MPVFQFDVILGKLHDIDIDIDMGMLSLEGIQHSASTDIVTSMLFNEILLTANLRLETSSPAEHMPECNSILMQRIMHRSLAPMKRNNKWNYYFFLWLVTCSINKYRKTRYCSRGSITFKNTLVSCH